MTKTDATQRHYQAAIRQAFLHGYGLERGETHPAPKAIKAMADTYARDVMVALERETAAP